MSDDVLEAGDAHVQADYDFLMTWFDRFSCGDCPPESLPVIRAWIEHHGLEVVSTVLEGDVRTT